jgi:dGTPase
MESALSQLAPYAATENSSKGRCFSEPPPQYRTEFQRDRDRIVHSAAFRRLEYKTQVFVNHEGDMFRTRLTHSIEVAQIGRGIARVLNLNEDLTEAICLAHDLGHTPFGHAGQDALNRCMKAYGGFEHNLQSLRVVEHLEQRYATFDGLNLTFETREGILKHCSHEEALKLGRIGERFIQGWQSGLEAQIANVADAIAYNNHDVDDGLRGGFLTIEQLDDIELFKTQLDEVRSIYPRLDKRRTIHETIRRIINVEVIDLIENSQTLINQKKPADIDAVRKTDHPLIQFSTVMAEKHQILKRFLRDNLYRHYRVHRMSLKAQKIISDLFEALNNDSKLLPPDFQQLVDQHKEYESKRARVVADYIAGMTDRFAIAEHKKLFDPFERT